MKKEERIALKAKLFSSRLWIFMQIYILKSKIKKPDF